MDWFRSWHGAPNDPKWLVIARKANVPPGMVSAIAWAILDHASQHKERGRVDNFDIETYAVWSGWEEEDIQSVIDAMTAKGIITDGRVTAWEKRQPKREDDSKERVSRWRDRQNVTAKAQNDAGDVTRTVTDSNADVTRYTDTGNADVTHGNADVTHGNADVTHGNAPEKIRGDTDTEKRIPESAQTPLAIANPAATPVVVPVSLPEWTERLRDSSNRQAVLVQMIQTLYPNSLDVPSYAYVAKVASKVGGAGRLAELLWQNSAKPPSGDVLAYIQAQAKPGANGTRPSNAKATSADLDAIFGVDIHGNPV